MNKNMAQAALAGKQHPWMKWREKPRVRLKAKKEKLKGKEYLKQLRKLQTELCILQDWVKHTGQRIVIVFEGRDAAGKEASSGHSRNE